MAKNVNFSVCVWNQKKNEDDEAEIKKQLSKYDSQLSTNEEKLDTDDSKFIKCCLTVLAQTLQILLNS